MCALHISAVRVYLNPSANWKSDNAKFGIYYWNGVGGAAHGPLMSYDSQSGYYYADIPEWNNNVIFLRMSPDRKSVV